MAKKAAEDAATKANVARTSRRRAGGPNAGGASGGDGKPDDAAPLLYVDVNLTPVIEHLSMPRAP